MRHRLLRSLSTTLGRRVKPRARSLKSGGGKSPFVEVKPRALEGHMGYVGSPFLHWRVRGDLNWVGRDHVQAVFKQAASLGKRPADSGAVAKHWRKRKLESGQERRCSSFQVLLRVCHSVTISGQER